MKSIVVVFIFLSGCYFYPEPDVSFSHSHWFESPHEIMMFVYEHVTYKPDPLDNWQTPVQTYTRQTGDCEDYAILMMYFAEEKGYISYLVVTEWKNTPGYYHAIVQIDNMYYDPSTGNLLEPSLYDPVMNIILRLSYSNVIRLL